MKKTTVISWDIVLLVSIILFLSTKNLDHYNLIIGFEGSLILSYAVRYHIKYYKLTGKIY